MFNIWSNVVSRVKMGVHQQWWFLSAKMELQSPGSWVKKITRHMLVGKPITDDGKRRKTTEKMASIGNHPNIEDIYIYNMYIYIYIYILPTY